MLFVLWGEVGTQCLHWLEGGSKLKDLTTQMLPTVRQYLLPPRLQTVATTNKKRLLRVHTADSLSQLGGGDGELVGESS